VQALEIYLKEIKNGDEVRFSAEANCIYKANWIDKFSSSIESSKTKIDTLGKLDKIYNDVLKK
jgi:hypothetical protein